MNWWPNYTVKLIVLWRGRGIPKTVRIQAVNRKEAEKGAIAKKPGAKVLSSDFSRS